MNSTIRTYSELSEIKDFAGRFDYLKLDGKIGDALFGYARYLNQVFYKSGPWKKARRDTILRDNGCDLGVEGYEIHGTIYVHHMNPITLDQLLSNDPILVDPEFLISCSGKTHEAITWGNEELLPCGLIIRTPNDMCPWKA